MSRFRTVRNGRLLAAAATLVAVAAPPAEATNPFDVDGVRADRAIVALHAEGPCVPVADTPMAWTIAGVLADLDKTRLGRLRRCATREAPVTVDRGSEPPFEIECFVHLRAGDARRVLEVGRAGEALVVRGAGSTEAALPIDRERFEALLEGAPAFRGPLDPVDLDVPVGRGFELPPPYLPSPVVMDRRTMKRRLYRDLNVVNEDADRRLGDERLHARLPAGYDPRRPAGLLVWVSPTSSGRIPGLFAPSLDEMNLVAVGVDDAGNERDLQDRLQLMFDAIATAARRFHLDERRVYVAGMSGGGKVSSILAICFPEVFAGAVPIVGLASHGSLDAAWERHRSPYFSRPRGPQLRLARERPIAVVTGPADFNYEEMKTRSALLRDDGFAGVRFVDVPGMAHTMPPRAAWNDALSYVDAPYQALRRAEVAAAAEALRAHLDGGDDAAAGAARLAHITVTAPFSEPAWRAVELLRQSSITK